jgi:hypothetical protein
VFELTFLARGLRIDALNHPLDHVPAATLHVELAELKALASSNALLDDFGRHARRDIHAATIGERKMRTFPIAALDDGVFRGP